MVGRFHADKLHPDQIGSTVFSFGCYLGEVFIRHHGGVWKMPAETALPPELKDQNNIMVVELPDGRVWNPIGKTFKLLENGTVDSVANFYRAANGGGPSRFNRRASWPPSLGRSA
jgi:hypothetical protein